MTEMTRHSCKYAMILALLAALALGWPATAAAQDSEAPAKKAVVLTLDGPIVEVPSPLAIFGPGETTLRNLTLTIDKAATDEEVGALVLHIVEPGFGLAQATELHNHLMSYRDSGKPLVAMGDTFTLGSYLIASTADRIVMTPVGGTMIVGISLDMYFFKNLLAKLGMQAQVVNTGMFKNAMEPFTHDAMSEGTRIQMGAILDEISEYYIESVAQARGLSVEATKEAIWNGPYLASESLESGIVTDLAYIEEFLDAYLEENNLEADYEYSATPKKKQESINLFSLFSGTSSSKKDTPSAGDTIAVVYAQGPIVDGFKDESPFASEQMIASEDFLEMLEEVAEDNPAAIVMRVDSPGGSAIASDRIWNRLEQFQRENEIPVIVSMGNVAASGGYYISMGADKIIAEPTTITGSIGVVGGRFILGETYSKIGVNKESLSIGENIGLIDETRPWNAKEIALLDKLLDDVYTTFTSKVAEGRGMEVARVKELGGGRVWTGEAALANGLIDELGGLSRAIDVAREMAELPDAPVVTYPKELSFMEFFEKLMSGSVSVTAASQASASMPPMLQAAAEVLPRQQVQMMWTMLTELRGTPKVMVIEPMSFQFR